MKKNELMPDEKLLSPENKVEIKNSAIHDRGVFATKDIAPEEIIEECPTIIIQKHDILVPQKLHDRLFLWDDENIAIALGYGSLYNHNNDNNAYYQQNQKNKTILFFAKKPIAKGEEILIHYGDDWFSSRKTDLPKKQNLKDEGDSRGLKKLLILFFILLVLSLVFPIQSSTNKKEPLQPKQFLEKILRTIKILEPKSKK